MRVGQFVKEARLADAGLAHYSNDLAVTAPRPLQRRAELVHFGITPDEAAQAPAGDRLKSRPCLASGDNVVNLDGSIQAPDDGPSAETSR